MMDRSVEKNESSRMRRGPEKRSRVYLLGTICFAVGVGWLLYRVSIHYSWQHTNATIKDVKSFRSSDSEGGQTTTYQVTVQYKTVDGRSLTVTPGYRSSQFNFDTGSSVAIIYNPEVPTQFKFADFLNFWVLPLFAALFGAAIVYLSKRKNS